MKVQSIYAGEQGPNRAGFTLAEVIISLAIAAVSIGGIISGYVIAANRAEWTLCSSAAQAMAMRHLEQTKTARWDSLTNELELVSTNVIEPLDIPATGAGVVFGTNTITVTTNTLSVPESVLVQVDCVWSLVSRGPFTNTAFSLRFREQ